jgi:dihydrofolate reductase
MGLVAADMTMSLDGFIADPNDGVEHLFAWFDNGDVTTPSASPNWSFHTTEAKALAGEKNVGVASPTIAQQCLNAGLLDAISVSLVPVLLGSGIPFFAHLASAPIQLDNPRVLQGDRVTHLYYPVRR